PEMIEHAEEENDIKMTAFLRIEIVEIHLPHVNTGAKKRQQELDRAAREVVIDSPDLRRAALLCLQREEAVPAANVQDTLAREINVIHPLQDQVPHGRGVLDPLLIFRESENAVGDTDAVIPLVLGQLLTERLLLAAQGCHRWTLSEGCRGMP